MLALNVTITGDKVVIDGLQELAAEMPAVIGRGLSHIAKDVHQLAFGWLTGPGRKPMRLTNRGAVIGYGADEQGKGGKIIKQKSALRGQVDSLGARPGSYPVPVITGNLRRLLDWIGPNRSKSSNGFSFATGPMEAMVYDSAAYASAIQDGTGSSAKYGPRQFIDDAFKSFNGMGGPAVMIEQEVQKEITKRGLA